MYWGVCMRKFYLLQFILLITSLEVTAQQTPQFSQNMFNQMAINPGFAGSSDMICATAINRQQWVGFAGAPATTVINVNSPFRLFGESHGAGITVYNDKYAFNNDIDINLNYAYRLTLANGKLGIGVAAGFINPSLNPTWKDPEGGTGTGDPNIPQQKESVMSFDLAFGLYYQTDKMYFGLSAQHLNQPALNKAVNPSVLNRTYYLSSGYNMSLPNPSFEIIPSIFIVTDGVSSSLTVNTNVLYNKRIWGGVSYRLNDAITAMFGVELFNGVRLGYAYDYSLSALSGYNDGTHEFMVSYSFTLKKEKPPQRYKSIRFL
jgi:type IX secretion system PorP/SprF family membrane protein